MRWAGWRRRSRSATTPRQTKRRWRRCAPTSSARLETATTAPGSPIRGSWRSPRKSSTARCRRPTRSPASARTCRSPPSDLLAVPEGTITEAGLRQNLNVGIGYIEAWLRGIGCVPLYNLMEDAATAEISRAQVWQWIRHGAQARGRPPHRRGAVPQAARRGARKAARCKPRRGLREGGRVVQRADRGVGLPRILDAAGLRHDRGGSSVTTSRAKTATELDPVSRRCKRPSLTRKNVPAMLSPVKMHQGARWRD